MKSVGAIVPRTFLENRVAGAEEYAQNRQHFPYDGSAEDTQLHFPYDHPSHAPEDRPDDQRSHKFISRPVLWS